MNQLNSYQPLPQSPEAEMGALACVLLETGGVDEQGKLLVQLHRNLFHDERYQQIFRAFKCLNIDEQVIDPITLSAWLKAKELFEAVGGKEIVYSLADKAPCASNFGHYLPILKEKAARREALMFAADLQSRALDEKIDPAALAADAKRRVDCIFRNSAESSRDYLRFYSPGECRNYSPPQGHMLVGDCHIVRGAVCVIAGAPGLGKSRAATALAVAGATGEPWFNLPVHTRFKTVILQAENGRYRLSREFSDIDGNLEDYIRISEPPPFGMAFDRPEFREALAKLVDDFKPGVVVVDPWNSVARNDKHVDYFATFETLKAALPTGDNAPALVIVAHTRKPSADIRKNGRGLMAEIAGSYVLTSVPRSVFVMQAASDDPNDDCVVWTCCKNNDGEMGNRSAWHRRNGLFAPCHDFDWKEFDGPPVNNHKVSTEAVAETIGATAAIGYTQLAQKLADNLKVSIRTGKDAIGRAAEAGLIFKDSTGLYRQTVTQEANAA